MVVENKVRQLTSDGYKDIRKKERTGRHLLRVFQIVTGMIVWLVSFVGLSARWGGTTWGDLDLDEIIFQLQAPLQGTGNGMLRSFFFRAVLPSFIILIVYILICRLLRKKRDRLFFSFACLIGAGVMTVVIRNYIWSRLDVEAWLRDRKADSTFIEDHYVDPNEVELRFPEHKRNLVYIYLESMEISYADKDIGGALPYNCIPELTSLAQENEDFSGNSDLLNGGIVYAGTGFTAGAMFAQSSGLPLKVSIGGNNMSTQTSFFPELKLIGDILQDQGYRQSLLIGSDATFGGRRLLFTDHGDFEIHDYVWAKEQQLIDEDYKVWWGYEDEKLFSFARDELLRLAETDEPFNLTLLTVDTHFEDGYVCRLCGDDFGNEQYANVLACSSRQVEQFVRWMQKQDFYDNTTIVVTGDHTTMDKDFLAEIDPDYQRKTYVSLINPAAENAQPEKTRIYSTFDMFPTTLAALGVEIAGNRLGLGTDLFSARETLSETYGTEYVGGEISKSSDFLSEIEKVDGHTERIVDILSDNTRMKFSRNKSEQTLTVRVLVKDNDGINWMNIDTVQVEYVDPKTEDLKVIELQQEQEGKRNYQAVIDISGWDTTNVVMLGTITTEEGSVYDHVCAGDPGLSHKRKKFAKYLQSLKKLKNEGCAIFFVIKDEGTAGLSEEELGALADLGLRTDLKGKFRTSYLAVLDGETVIEKEGKELLSCEGTLHDGETDYVLKSGGYDAGNTGSIVIDGQEKAPGKRGINISVFSPDTGIEIDSSCFDTYQAE